MVRPMQSNNPAPMTLEEAQREFRYLPRRFIYMNNGTEGSMPAGVIKYYRKALVEWASNPTKAYETHKVFGKFQKANRQAMAEFLGVGVANICLTDNTTMGMGMVIMGLGFERGDKLIITNHEHPCVTSPLWVLKNRLGIAVEVMEFPEPCVLRDMDADALLDHLFPVTEQLKTRRPSASPRFIRRLAYACPWTKFGAGPMSSTSPI
jgi:selenocysteine lyase/cysteine desulfurase